MFRFAAPYWFLLLIPAAVAVWFVYRRRVSSGLLFSAALRASTASPTWRSVAADILPAFTLTGIALSVFAMARPQQVLSRVSHTADAIAIQMVVDISGSMEALDMSETTTLGTRYRTRLDAVKETFADFVKSRPDDLVGLITFGGYATTRCPLTTDHAALLHVLDGVQVPVLIHDSGGRVVNQEELLTAIGDALALACARLKDAEVNTKIIVLLSDGESNTGIIEPEQAAEVARKMGIKVYSIGVGTTGRAPFRVRDRFGRTSIQYAHITMDEDLLRRISERTGGLYFNVLNPKGMESALREIDRLEKTRIERDVYHSYQELFPRFLWPAMALAFLGTALNMFFTGRLL